MRVEVLRTPGLDLVYDLAAKGVTGPVEIPKDLVEGDVRDLPDDVAEALITCNVARKADKKSDASKTDPDPPRPAPPGKGHAPPAK